uniref:Uncharacterized protein n=1 Tax=Oryza barthii TaxID=65489 RepID=A0A0D3G8V7_9ORYZ
MVRWLKEAKEMEVLECMGQAARRPGSHGKDEAQRVWEAEMARQLKETEELQSWAATEAPTKSEEEKRKRVHRKLEKLHRPTSPATTPPVGSACCRFALHLLRPPSPLQCVDQGQTCL